LAKTKIPSTAATTPARTATTLPATNAIPQLSHKKTQNSANAKPTPTKNFARIAMVKTATPLYVAISKAKTVTTKTATNVMARTQS
jgi:hypothetical protein